jgi:hypothetical protein
MATQRVVEPMSIMDGEQVVVEEVIITDVPAVDVIESDIPSIPEE